MTRMSVRGGGAAAIEHSLQAPSASVRWRTYDRALVCAVAHKMMLGRRGARLRVGCVGSSSFAILKEAQRPAYQAIGISSDLSATASLPARELVPVVFHRLLRSIPRRPVRLNRPGNLCGLVGTLSQIRCAEINCDIAHTGLRYCQSLSASRIFNDASRQAAQEIYSLRIELTPTGERCCGAAAIGRRKGRPESQPRRSRTAAQD